MIRLLYASTCFEHCCAHHQEVKIVLYSIWYHHTVSGRPVQSHLSTCEMVTYRCNDTRCCITQIDLLMMSAWCSKHVEAYNKLIIKQDFVH